MSIQLSDSMHMSNALRSALAAFAGSLLLSFFAAGVHAAPDGEIGDRTSVSRHIVTGGRDGAANAKTTVEEYEPLVTEGLRNGKTTRGGSLKPGAGSLQSPQNDFWIFDADVVLFDDDDRDGYFHGIDLLFDADTIYSAAEVYAVVYLSRDLGPWNEYGITEDFWIFGASGDDEYVLITELMSGYPRGDYDLLIELFDADTHHFLASFGPEDSSALSYLPLEDFRRDEPARPTAVVVSHGGGGASSTWTIAFLLLMLVVTAVRRIWRHRNDALYRIDSPPPCWRDFTPRD